MYPPVTSIASNSLFYPPIIYYNVLYEPPSDAKDDIVSPALRCLRVSNRVSIPVAVLVLFIQWRMGHSGNGAPRYCPLEFRHPMPEDVFNAHVQPYVDGKNELFVKGYKVDREDAGASSGLDESSIGFVVCAQFFPNFFTGAV